MSQNTVRLALAPVRALFATALEEELIKTNPTLGVRLPRIEQPVGDRDGEDVKALTEVELRKLIEKTPEDYRLLIELLAQTGLRVGEAFALRWQDVQGDRLAVRRRWYKGSFDQPKVEVRPS